MFVELAKYVNFIPSISVDNVRLPFGSLFVVANSMAISETESKKH